MTEISLADSELNIEEVEQCMIESAKRISLPPMIQGMAQISFCLKCYNYFTELMCCKALAGLFPKNI